MVIIVYNGIERYITYGKSNATYRPGADLADAPGWVAGRGYPEGRTARAEREPGRPFSRKNRR